MADQSQGEKHNPSPFASSTVEAFAHLDSELPTDSSFPRQFGTYTLLKSLGEGGFGEVFLAHEDRTWRLVAIKVLSERRSDEASIRRFELELRIGTELKHEGILSVIDQGIVRGRRYFVMPYIDGSDLLHTIGKQPITPADAVAIVERVADAVAHAHNAGYLHRDIKPANILVERATNRPFIADFGLAMNTALNTRFTASHDVLGTQPYMPPEQIDPALGNFSPATDVYALGVTLYQLLTGVTPFPRKDRPGRDIKHQIAWTRPLAPSTINSAVHPDLDRVCLVCLQKSPFDRYQSAAELAADLRRFQAHRPIEATVPGAGKRLLRRCQRRPVQTALAIALVSLTIAAAIIAKNERSKAETSNAQFVSADSKAKAMAQQKRTSQYTSDLQEIQTAWDRNDVEKIRFLLTRNTPSDALPDLRGIEWYYWNHRLRSQALVIRTERQCRSIAFTPDAATLAVTTDARMSVWNLDTRSLLFDRTIGNHQPAGLLSNDSRDVDHSVAVSEDGRYVAAVGFTDIRGQRRGFLSVWSLNGTEIMTIGDEPQISGRAVTFSPDSSSVVTGGFDNAWTEWQIPSGARRQNSDEDLRSALSPSEPFQPGPSFGFVAWAAVWDIRFCDRYPFFLVTTCDRLPPFFWRWPDLPFPERGNANGAIGVSGSPITMLRLKDGVATLSVYKRAVLGEGVNDIHTLVEGGATCVLHSDPDVAVARADRTINVWTIYGAPGVYPVSNTLRGAEYEIKCMAMSKDRRLLAAADSQGTIMIHSLALQSAAPTTDQSSHIDVGVVESDAADTTASFDSARSTLRVLRSSDTIEIPLSHEPQAIGFDPTNHFVAASYWTTSAEAQDAIAEAILWDLTTNHEVCKIAPVESKAAADASFSADGQRFVIPYALTHKGIALHDAVSGSTQLLLNELPILEARLSASGKYLAVRGDWGAGAYNLTENRWIFKDTLPAASLAFDPSETHALFAGPSRDAQNIAVTLDTGATLPLQLGNRSTADLVLAPEGHRAYVPTDRGIDVFATDNWTHLVTIPYTSGDRTASAVAADIRRQLRQWRRDVDAASPQKQN